MSEIQKCPNLISIFQKCLKFKNVPKVGRGGGATLIGTLSQIFSIFYFDTSPYAEYDIFISMSRMQNYRKYTVWSIACENRCTHVTLSEQVFRQFHVWTALYIWGSLNGCSEGWLSEHLFIHTITALNNYIYITDKFWIRRGSFSLICVIRG